VTVALLIVLAVLAVVAWRALRAWPLAVLSVVAVAGWLAHHGALPVPEAVRAPVRATVSSAEAWRAERIAALRCRAAVMAALSAGDDEVAVRRLDAACGNRRRDLRPQLEAADELLERGGRVGQRAG
jgi:hypothetical protein